MKMKVTDFAIGAIVIALVIAAAVYLVKRVDDCRDKATNFVRTAPAVTAKAGKVISAGTSSWLSGQSAARTGERSYYFIIKGERAKLDAIVSADRATCTCRLESIN